MAMICCLECKNSFSEFAEACPCCGYPAVDIKNQIANNREMLVERKRQMENNIEGLVDDEIKENEKIIEKYQNEIEELEKEYAPIKLQIDKQIEDTRLKRTEEWENEKNARVQVLQKEIDKIGKRIDGIKHEISGAEKELEQIFEKQNEQLRILSNTFFLNFIKKQRCNSTINELEKQTLNLREKIEKEKKKRANQERKYTEKKKEIEKIKEEKISEELLIKACAHLIKNDPYEKKINDLKDSIEWCKKRKICFEELTMFLPWAIRDEICYILEKLGKISSDELNELSFAISKTDRSLIRKSISHLKCKFIIRVEKEPNTGIEYLSLMPKDEREVCTKEKAVQRKANRLEKEQQKAEREAKEAEIEEQYARNLRNLGDDLFKQAFDAKFGRKEKSVIGSAVVGGLVAGPAGAVVGAIYAADKNSKNKK